MAHLLTAQVIVEHDSGQSTLLDLRACAGNESLAATEILNALHDWAKSPAIAALAAQCELFGEEGEDDYACPLALVQMLRSAQQTSGEELLAGLNWALSELQIASLELAYRSPWALWDAATESRSAWRGWHCLPELMPQENTRVTLHTGLALPL